MLEKINTAVSTQPDTYVEKCTMYYLKRFFLQKFEIKKSDHIFVILELIYKYFEKTDLTYLINDHSNTVDVKFNKWI